AVRGGVDRQVAHERIRQHSIAAARALKDGASRNDLLDRLGADSQFGVPVADLEDALAPASFIGRAPQQVDEFLEEVVAPLLAGVAATERERAEVRV
ncbi:MAG TPA: adenylosuccinate lyase, partial [Gemmatimonadaceae bacterium]|nr:adenylosuccinate lyase [Gemmatimonadaceae bacterium]